MTKVFIHGRLGEEFGEYFELYISKPKDVLLAIDANHEGFQKRMLDLAKSGAQYSLIADNQAIGTPEEFIGKKKIKEIHIVPTLFGAGVGALAIGIGIVSYAASFYTTYLVSAILVAVAIAAISYGIQTLLAKPPSQNIAGQTGESSATSRSYLFSNRDNLTQQGGPVPLGYGRLRLGSSVIQQSIKNYPNSISTFNEFVNQSTQQSQGSMSLISNQQI